MQFPCLEHLSVFHYSFYSSAAVCSNHFNNFCQTGDVLRTPSESCLPGGGFSSEQSTSCQRTSIMSLSPAVSCTTFFWYARNTRQPMLIRMTTWETPRQEGGAARSRTQPGKCSFHWRPHVHETSVTMPTSPGRCTCIISVVQLGRFPGSGTSLA